MKIMSGLQGTSSQGTLLGFLSLKQHIFPSARSPWKLIKHSQYLLTNLNVGVPAGCCNIGQTVFNGACQDFVSPILTQHICSAVSRGGSW